MCSRGHSQASFATSVLVLSVAAGCAGVRADLREGRLGAEQIGMASYYSPKLVGRHTASGERYDARLFTAAHPVMPFGTFVHVVRTDGVPREVVVRINDRCAGKRKIIDLSGAAARQLDMMRAGLVPVHLRVIPAPPPVPVPRPAPVLPPAADPVPAPAVEVAP